MKFEIKNRWSGAVIYACELDAEVAGQSYSMQLGFAVRKMAKESADKGECANLRDANLRDADLSAANLSAANLRAADLSAANLSAADLTPVRDDLWAVLSSAPAEVEGLRLALAEGRVEGSTYTGACACLVGTLANIRKCDVNAFEYLAPNSNRPIERFFLSIHKGDTPETNQFSKLALEWTDLWLSNMRAAFGKAA